MNKEEVFKWNKKKNSEQNQCPIVDQVFVGICAKEWLQIGNKSQSINSLVDLLEIDSYP